jgi:hypothetical protein
MPNKKRGYFFILDATLALFVLAIGVFLILTFYVSAPQAVQVEFLSNDVMNFYSNTRIKDLNNPYAGIGGELWKDGSITDPENTLLQQIGEFYSYNKLDVAEKFVQNVSGIVPSQFKFEIWIDSNRVYPINPSQDHNDSRNSSRLLLTSKKLTFGIQNKTSTKLWGPYKAEVFLWER